MAKNGITVHMSMDKFGIAKRRLTEAMAENIAETAKEIEADISDGVRSDWDSDNIPVKIQEQNKLLVYITTGSRTGYYAGFLEFGTVDFPSRPVVIPAAKRAKTKFMAKSRNLDRKLGNL